MRPKKFSSDNSSKLLAIRHALLESEKYFNKSFKICVDLDITAPLRKIDDIKKAIKKFKKINLVTSFQYVMLKKIHISIWLRDKKIK